jgi:AAA ATPase domain
MLASMTDTRPQGKKMRLIQFRVQNYRSIKDTDWINVSSLTAFVGQNEAGKSNLCEALYRINPYVDDAYRVDEDWPVDDWGKKDASGLVCEARFEIADTVEMSTLLDAVGLLEDAPVANTTEHGATSVEGQKSHAGEKFTKGRLPKSLTLKVSKFYDNKRTVI